MKTSPASLKISRSALLSGLSASNLPVDDGLPVGVHRLADLDGDLDLQLPALVVLHLLADLLLVEVRDVDYLVLTVLVAVSEYSSGEGRVAA